MFGCHLIEFQTDKAEPWRRGSHHLSAQLGVGELLILGMPVLSFGHFHSTLTTAQYGRLSGNRLVFR